MAVHGEIRFVHRSAFYGHIRESWFFWMDKSKWEIYFHNSLEIKWHMQTGENAVLSGQRKTTKRFCWICYKVRGCCYGLCSAPFFIFF